ncbi:head-tail connector [Butyrivibrio virus Bo-Finn]|nr:head-tail joining protein [Butyrivibrio virus Arian]QHJ73671.1 head-tail connector [Butyrivibrio virus Bo-Finn]
MWKPIKARQMTTAATLQIPTTQNVQGVRVKSFIDSVNVMCNWAAMGGTEYTQNGIIIVQDTAQIVTWYNPNITSGCRLKRGDGAIYEIIGEPENIEMRNMLMSFKVQRIKGGA